MEIKIDSARATRMLVAVAGGFVCLSALGSVLRSRLDLANSGLASGDHLWLRRFFQLFSLDAEMNLSVLFCVFLHLAAATLFGMIARVSWAQQDRDRRYWASLSALFVCTAVDEAWPIHERLIEPVGRILNLVDGQAGPFYFAWVVPGICVVLGLAVVYWRFLRRQEATGWMMMLAAAIFVGGALGMEVIGGWYLEGHSRDLVYRAIATLEEALEMAGMILLIRTLLKHLAATQGDRRLEIAFS